MDNRTLIDNGQTIGLQQKPESKWKSDRTEETLLAFVDIEEDVPETERRSARNLSLLERQPKGGAAEEGARPQTCSAANQTQRGMKVQANLSQEESALKELAQAHMLPTSLLVPALTSPNHSVEGPICKEPTLLSHVGTSKTTSKPAFSHHVALDPTTAKRLASARQTSADKEGVQRLLPLLSRGLSGKQAKELSGGPDSQHEQPPPRARVAGVPLRPPYLLPDAQFKQVQEDIYIMQKIGKHDLHQSGRRFNFDLPDQVKLQMVLLAEVLGQKDPRPGKDLEKSYKTYAVQRSRLSRTRSQQRTGPVTVTNEDGSINIQDKRTGDSSIANLNLAEKFRTKLRNDSQRSKGEDGSHDSKSILSSIKELQKQHLPEERQPCLNSLRKEVVPGKAPRPAPKLKVKVKAAFAFNSIPSQGPNESQRLGSPVGAKAPRVRPDSMDSTEQGRRSQSKLKSKSRPRPSVLQQGDPSLTFNNNGPGSCSPTSRGGRSRGSSLVKRSRSPIPKPVSVKSRVNEAWHLLQKNRQILEHGRINSDIASVTSKSKFRTTQSYKRMETKKADAHRNIVELDDDGGPKATQRPRAGRQHRMRSSKARNRMRMAAKQQDRIRRDDLASEFASITFGSQGGGRTEGSANFFEGASAQNVDQSKAQAKQQQSNYMKQSKSTACLQKNSMLAVAGGYSSPMRIVDQVYIRSKNQSSAKQSNKNDASPPYDPQLQASTHGLVRDQAYVINQHKYKNLITNMKNKDQGEVVNRLKTSSSTKQGRSKAQKVMDFQKNYLRMTDLDMSESMNIERALAIQKPSIRHFNGHIPVNRHQNLIFKNTQESLNLSMTSSTKDKVKQELKQKISILKKINKDKLKLSTKGGTRAEVRRSVGGVARPCDANKPYTSKRRESHQQSKSPNKDQLYTERLNNPNDLVEDIATKSTDRVNFMNTTPIVGGFTAANFGTSDSHTIAPGPSTDPRASGERSTRGQRIQLNTLHPRTENNSKENNYTPYKDQSKEETNSPQRIPKSQERSLETIEVDELQNKLQTWKNKINSFQPPHLSRSTYQSRLSSHYRVGQTYIKTRLPSSKNRPSIQTQSLLNLDRYGSVGQRNWPQMAVYANNDIYASVPNLSQEKEFVHQSKSLHNEINIMDSIALAQSKPPFEESEQMLEQATTQYTPPNPISRASPIYRADRVYKKNRTLMGKKPSLSDKLSRNVSKMKTRTANASRVPNPTMGKFTDIKENELEKIITSNPSVQRLHVFRNGSSSHRNLFKSSKKELTDMLRATQKVPTTTLQMK